MPDQLSTPKMCTEGVRKTQEICAEALRKDPFLLQFVPDCFKSQEICAEVVREEQYLLHVVPDQSHKGIPMVFG